MRRLLATACTALLAVSPLLLTPSAAHAASTLRKDADDTRGALDLAKVQLKTQGKKMVITLTNHGSFADSDVEGLSALGIDFKVGKKVRGMAVKSAGAGLVSEICTYPLSGPPTWKNCSDVKVERLSGTTVRITVPRAKIDKGARVYRWSAGALNTQTDACPGLEVECIDRVPDNKDKFITWRL